MAMNITKISMGTGITYLLQTVAAGDLKGPMGYYNQAGNPPGYWLGAGLTGLGINMGEIATAGEAQALFSGLLHPRTLQPLGATNTAADAVSGYDLTFRIPKSISVLWGVADANTQRAIEQAHDDAVAAALKFIEAKVASTRSGHGGVATSQILGLIATAYKHFETRDGDPHLHTHVAVANKVQRAHDGKWLTLDGRALYGAAVMVSEYHENYLLDLLHQRLGMNFEVRDTPVARTSRSVVADIVGFPADMVEKFSSRRAAISKYAADLTATWMDAHGGDEPPRKVRDKINLEAWAATRAPKEKVVASRSELGSRWRRQLAEYG